MMKHRRGMNKDEDEEVQNGSEDEHDLAMESDNFHQPNHRDNHDDDEDDLLSAEDNIQVTPSKYETELREFVRIG
jgi:hypothetical protein